MIFGQPKTWPQGQSARMPTPLREWTSAGDTWRLRLVRELRGVDLQLLRLAPLFDPYEFGDPWNDAAMVDGVCRYFLGADRMAIALTPLVVMTALQGVSERARADHVAEMLPEQTVDPMRDDHGCWRRLCVFAGVDHWAGINLRLAGQFQLFTNVASVDELLLEVAAVPSRGLAI